MTGLVGILLAAGRGTRYRENGGNNNKLFERIPDGFPRAGLPVALGSLTPLKAVVDEVVVVIRSGNIVLSQGFAARGCIVIECMTDGMGESLALAISQKPMATGWLVALADMPFIQEETMRSIANAMTPEGIVAPVFRGKRGHPVGFGHNFGPALETLSGDEGARHLMQTNKPKLIVVNDPGIHADIDTPADWVAAQKLHAAAAAAKS